MSAVTNFPKCNTISACLTWVGWYRLIGGLTVHQYQFGSSSMFFPPSGELYLFEEFYSSMCLCVCTCVCFCVCPGLAALTPACWAVWIRSLGGLMNVGVTCHHVSQCYPPAGQKSQKVCAYAEAPWGKRCCSNRHLHTHFYSLSDCCTLTQSYGQESIIPSLLHCWVIKITCYVVEVFDTRYREKKKTYFEWIKCLFSSSLYVI